MSHGRFMISDTPYSGTATEQPEQLNLFDNQEDMLESQSLEKAIKLLKSHQKTVNPTSLDNLANAILTFNLAPGNNVWKHLKKAKIAHTANESLASDWIKVSRDLELSFLMQALKVNRGIE